ncbi:MAG: BatA domain-containing protein [Pirellulales bacterium]
MNPTGPVPWMQLAIPAIAAAAILSFYFLKVRRKPVLVPSTYLWRRTIQDNRVNALWQRLRRSILLLLQLLAVLAAAVALLRPRGAVPFCAAGGTYFWSTTARACRPTTLRRRGSTRPNGACSNSSTA